MRHATLGSTTDLRTGIVDGLPADSAMLLQFGSNLSALLQLDASVRQCELLREIALSKVQTGTNLSSATP